MQCLANTIRIEASLQSIYNNQNLEEEEIRVTYLKLNNKFIILSVQQQQGK